MEGERVLAIGLAVSVARGDIWEGSDLDIEQSWTIPLAKAPTIYQRAQHIMGGLRKIESTD